MALRWQCNTCQEMFKAWAPAERHADAHHGARLDLIFEEGSYVKARKG